MRVFAETQRFILRELLPSDTDGMYALDSDPEVLKYLGNKPISTKQKAAETIEFVRQQYLDHGIGRWAIICKENNEFVGWSGLKFVTVETNKHINYYDLGYRLLKKYWGQGIATETALASLDFAFNKLNLEEVFASAHIENAASNTVLQKIGFRFLQTFEYDGLPCNWYRITKEEWEK